MHGDNHRVERDKNMKKRIIIIIILSFVFLGLSIYKEINSQSILYIGNNTEFYIKNNKIIKKTSNLKNTLEKAKVLFNNEFVDGYMLVKDNEFGKNIEIYDENKNKIISNRGLLLYKGNKNITVPEVVNVTNYTKSEERFINDKLKSNDIEGEIESFNKYAIDLNNDGELEEIYSLLIKSNDTETSFIFMDENVLLKEKDSLDNLPAVKTYKIYMIIDINDDKDYEIIIANTTGDDSPTYYDIYKYDNDSFIKVGDR